jgi:hypothetical protein
MADMLVLNIQTLPMLQHFSPNRRTVQRPYYSVVQDNGSGIIILEVTLIWLMHVKAVLKRNQMHVLHVKYRSIARAMCFFPGTSSTRETIGRNVMPMTSGAEGTVFIHSIEL